MEMLKKMGMLLTVMAALGMGAVTMTGCEQETTTEDAIEDAADNLDRAGENVQDAAENAQENVEDAAEDMTN